MKTAKKQRDDWEAELGETIASANGLPTEATKDEKLNDLDDAEEDTRMGGGLLAALKKNKSKKAKKGKMVDNDFVEGEDPGTASNGALDLASKEPEEAAFDDEDDIFAGRPKKGKPGAGKNEAEQKTEEADEEGGKMKSKKEKEKEKREREKQRKKEQVRFYAQIRPYLEFPIWKANYNVHLGR
jgi:translation initiation factor 5B